MEKLIIGAYCLAPYARTEEHIRDCAACGIDVMLGVPYDRALLDRFAAYGLGAVVQGVVPGWFGGTGKNAGTMHIQNPLRAYSAAGFEGHSAVWGIDIGDEPSSCDFPHYGKVFARVQEEFPGCFPYLNLYPSYGMVPWSTPSERIAQLGTADYSDYVAQYCLHVPSDYLCFDFYPYAADTAQFLKDLQVVSAACRESGREMWTVLQVNSHDPDQWLSLEALRCQAITALAFGARRIHWACYTAGWWYHQVLDERGEKTQQYEKLRRVNAELHGIGEAYMRYRWVQTHFVTQKPGSISGFGAIFAEGGTVLAGELRSPEGTALMLYAQETVMLHVRTAHAVRVRSGTAERVLPRNEAGEGALTLPAGCGMLLML